MDLQDVFDAIVMKGETLRFQLPDTATFNSRRAALLRKWRKYQQQRSELGLPVETDTYIKCVWSEADNVATFCLSEKPVRSFGTLL